MEQRLVELETKLAFQEQAMEELNTLMVQQRRELEQLAETVENLRQRLAAANISAVCDESEETPPPHY